MGITSINNAYSASYGAYNQKLTQKTKEELDSNGIIYNANITEVEGKKLLLAHKAQNEAFGNQNQNSQNSFKRAQELANILGIEVKNGTSFDELLILIEEALKEKINSAGNDIRALEKLKSLSQELANIQAQSKGSSGYDNTNQALMQSLEMLSEYNKNFLYR